jgi:hypothetical protein
MGVDCNAGTFFQLGDDPPEPDRRPTAQRDAIEGDRRGSELPLLRRDPAIRGTRRLLEHRVARRPLEPIGESYHDPN